MIHSDMEFTEIWSYYIKRILEEYSYKIQCDIDISINELRLEADVLAKYVLHYGNNNPETSIQQEFFKKTDNLTVTGM